MALDNATKRVASCHMEEARTTTTIATTTTITTSTTTSSELSSESDGSEFFSDSDACRALADVEDVNVDAEYKYSPLSCDSDVDNELENPSDESAALLAHEILCCDHDTDTESDSDEDDNDLETKHNYALLMCSEDDDEFDRVQQKLKFDQERKQKQKLIQLKQQGASFVASESIILLSEHSSNKSHELESKKLND
ncbi:hypothetical protein ACLKA7_006661 [Drosophila subpalustris]